ncbi:GGDEF domain-containing protein [Sulfurimonas sp. HSL-1716]|uniref:GGDEF domain-containing protein n=1 Tax=Hydrocurvibacter sulfurireducens TaxID=3131937 RepID=UPI0031F9AB9B
MNTKNKFLLMVTLMLAALATATIVNVGLNFREFAINAAVAKAKLTANIVKDGLTAHMVNHIMDKRKYFLNTITQNNEVKNLWIARGQNVIEQYGKGFSYENARDEIDREVLGSGKMVKKVTETPDTAELRITIPYIAQSTAQVSCLECHSVNDGAILGAISMEFDINSVRNASTLTIAKIFGINVIFIFIALLVLNHYIKPYMELFSNLRDGIKKAHSGDFSHRFETRVSGEGKDVAEQINTLFHKMQETFGEIKHSLSTFVTKSNLACSDPLFEAKIIIKELADIYKFKKTIELDDTKELVYERITTVLQTKYDIHNFSFYEIDRINKTREAIYISHKSYCNTNVDKNVNLCRAYRTDTDIISTDFPDLCTSCHHNESRYICIPFDISDEVSLTLNVVVDNASNFEDIAMSVSSIKNYIEAAKPVIESKILTDKLRDTTLRDGMTGLYNRRFLEQFIDKLAKQALRNDTKYSVLMLDIDYFKMVNDTYGHDMGDVVIKALSEVIRTSIREADLAVRYGGEEFVILLHNATPEGSLSVAQKIHDEFNKRKFNVNGEVIQKTISIGISQFPDDANSIWKAIKYADTALYYAKEHGRDQVIEFKQEMFEGEGDNF